MNVTLIIVKIVAKQGWRLVSSLSVYANHYLSASFTQPTNNQEQNPVMFEVVSSLSAYEHFH